MKLKYKRKRSKPKIWEKKKQSSSLQMPSSVKAYKKHKIHSLHVILKQYKAEGLLKVKNPLH